MDHTVLGPATTQSTVAKFCDEAKQFKFASVCVNPALPENVIALYEYAKEFGTYPIQK